MSDRANPKAKLLNLQEFPELTTACVKFLDQSSSDIFEFINSAQLIEKELKEKEPEEILIQKEVLAACCKAAHEVFVKAIREIAKDNESTQEMILMIFTKSRPIFWNLSFILKTFNGKVKIEKNMISHIKEVVLWILHKSKPENFIIDFFGFLTLVYELIINKKKADVKDSDLYMISSFLLTFLSTLLKSPSFYATANCIYPFLGFQKALSIFSTSSQEICNTDLIHFLLQGIEMLSKVELNHLSDFISLSLPSVLVYLLEVQDFCSHKQSTNTELAIEKYLISLRLLRLLCSQSNRLETVRHFFKANSDKINNVFFHTLENYLQFYFFGTSKFFEEDEGIIGKCFKLLLDIMTVAYVGSDKEGIPILFCSMILQKVCIKQDINDMLARRPPQVQSFILQFLEKYLGLLTRKKQGLSFDFVFDCRLVELLFSVPLFEVRSAQEDRLGYEQAALETWNNIWKKFIMTGNQNLRNICKSIIDTIKIYSENVLHLVKVNKWLQEQALVDEEFVQVSITSGLIEAIFAVIGFIKRSGKTPELLVDFFLNVKFFLSQFKGDELNNSGTIMDLIITESFLYDPDCSDLCMTCLSFILRFQNESNYLKFGNLLKTMRKTSMKIKLLGSMQSILKENSSKRNVQEGFARARMLITLKEVIIETAPEEEEIIDLWVSCFECVRFLIEENPTCKKNLQDFDFSKIANLIRTERFAKIRSLIYSKSIESLLYILFECNNLGKPQMRMVRTPEVIPLVVELLTDSDQLDSTQDYFEHVKACLEDCYNAAHFANSRTTDLLLDAFCRTSNRFLMEFISNTLPIVICHHVTPQELKKIIDISGKCAKFKEKQGIMLDCLAKGVKNSCCYTDHYKFEKNHTCLSSTRYFCFRSNKSILKCEVSPSESLLGSKDFSVFFWMYPDDTSQNCELLVFNSQGNHSLVLSMIGGDLVFQYFQDGITFTVTGSSQLIEKQWNLLGLSLKSTSSLLFKNDKAEVDIFINSNKIPTKTSGKLTRPKETFCKLLIGNSEKLISSFKGRIISLFILKKSLTLNQFREVYFMSFQYNLGFNPEAVSTSEVIQSDKPTLKYIYENIHFFWHPRSRLPEVSNVERVDIVDECERFNGVSIIEAIAANGGLNIFLPLIKQAADRAGIITLLNMIADVCIAQSVEMILNEEFFGLLTFVLEESIKKPNVQLVDALINIVGHLEWNPCLNLTSFKSLFLNKKLWKDLDSESHSHYTGVLSLNVRRHFKCEAESLYGIFDQLSAVQKDASESFLEIWQNVIPDEIEPENVDGILVIVFAMFSQNRDLLFKFLEILSKKHFKKECFDSLYFSVVFLMKEINEGQAQACLLKFVLKLCEDYCEDLAKDKKQVQSMKDEFEFIHGFSSSIDKYLEKNILTETFEELIIFCKKAVEMTEKKKAEKFITFLKIITKRLPFCQEKEKFLKRLEIESEKENFAVLLYDREDFPFWLIEIYRMVPEQTKSLGIKVFVTCAKSRNFNKLRKFLTAIPDIHPGGLTWCLDFFTCLLKELNRSMFKAELFESTTGKSVVVHFLDFIGVLEDLLDFSCSGNSAFDLGLYVNLVGFIVETAEALQMISSTHPPIPLLSFDLLLMCMRESPQKDLSENSIYLRDGGFLRLILKFIFIGLSLEQHSKLIESLKFVLKGGPGNLGYLTMSNEFRNRWESRFSAGSYEKFTDFYTSLRERKDDTMHSVKFLTQYIIAECTELLSHDKQNPILDFLKDFIRDTEALSEIESKNRITDVELEAFYRLLIDRKLDVHSTGRSRVVHSDRNKNILFLTNYVDFTRTDSKNFLIEMKELFQRYKLVKDNNEDLLNLLTSEAWLSKIHFFFLASTSMKLNFISSTVKIESSRPQEFKNEDSFDKVQKFVENKLVVFKNYRNIYEQKQDRNRRMAQKTYKEFCDNFENLKLILNGSQVGKFRLKQVVDGMGRMLLLKKSYQEIEIPSFPSKTRFSLMSPHHINLHFFKTNEEISPEVQISSEEEDLKPSNFSCDLEDTIRVECERISADSSLFGILEFSHDYLLFVSEGKEKPKDGIFFASALEFTISKKKTEKIWKISEIDEVFPRRFIHRMTAFELFFKNGKSMLFNVFSEENCNQVLDFMKSWARSYGKVVKESKKLLPFYRKSWVKGQISNLEYLLLLNKLASRSFNDISQYPVFPWVLKDYKSPDLRFEDESIYRNLSFPIGAQSDEGKSEATRKYSMFQEEEVDSFHYGSHYSSAGVVLHYLVRIDPFTEMAKSLQGGTFDVPDRLFYSIEAAWESGQGTTGDVKELVPEMYYLPEMLLNVNKEHFGCRQDSVLVNHVELPPWASNPIDFVIKHRKALESHFVSSHLHEWIDLIFGFRQKNQAAIEVFNLFSSISYEDNFKKLFKTTDLETLQGYIEQVVHFGQTPVQLMKTPHPQKEIVKSSASILERVKMLNVLDNECVSVASPVLCLLNNQMGIWSLRVSGAFLFLCKENTLDKANLVRLEGVRDMKLSDWEEAVQWKYTFNQGNHLVLIRSAEQYCLWGEDMVVSGFHMDNSFKVHTLRGGLIKSVHHHAGLVTCVTATSDVLFTGSLDTSIAAWLTFAQKDDKIKPFKIYLGHSEAIRQLAVQEKYNILLSLSVNGVMIMHEVRSAKCLRKVSFDSPIRLVTVSDFGLVAVYIQKIGIKIFTINETEFIKTLQKSDVKFLKFSENGEYLLIGTTLSLSMLDILEISPSQTPVKTIEIPFERYEGYELETLSMTSGKDQLLLVLNSEKDSKLLKFK